jgi:TatD DNase family protein
MTLPPIDAHAHIEPCVPAWDLAGLGAFVVAVTREPSEWQLALRRRDDLAVWGVGVHPGLPAAIEAFDGDAFNEAVESSLVVGEVGLDGRSKAAATEQQRVFDAVLAVVADHPRPTTIHSVAAGRRVLNALADQPIAAPILHWWRGTKSETEEAVAMGCFFSLNGAEVKNPKVLDLLPPERVLTETDFPHSTRNDRAATQPAAVTTIENALMRAWDLDELGLRRRLWRNLVELYERCDLIERLPEAVQDLMLTAGLDEVS